MYTSEYPIIGVTVDIVVFSEDRLRILLITRGDEPFKGKYALPGGFLNPDETLKWAAARELKEETALDIDPDFLLPLPAVYTPGRDPRGPTVSNPFWTYIPKEMEEEISAGDDAATVQWVSWLPLKPHDLAFDHYSILLTAIYKLTPH